MKYTVDYFIEKFSAIPEDNWITGVFYNLEVGCCARGWCGTRSFFVPTLEDMALQDILPKVWTVNNGDHPTYNQPNPKLRILAALNDVKNGVYNVHT